MSLSEEPMREDDAVISFDDDNDEFAELFSFATSDDVSPKKDYTHVLASVLPLPADDDHSEDSFLELLEQHKDPLTVVGGRTGEQAVSVPPDLEGANMQELLDWLDQEDDDQETARQQLQEEELVLPPTLKPVVVQTHDECFASFNPIGTPSFRPSPKCATKCIVDLGSGVRCGKPQCSCSQGCSVSRSTWKRRHGIL